MTPWSTQRHASSSRGDCAPRPRDSMQPLRSAGTWKSARNVEIAFGIATCSGAEPQPTCAQAHSAPPKWLGYSALGFHLWDTKRPKVSTAIQVGTGSQSQELWFALLLELTMSTTPP